MKHILMVVLIASTIASCATPPWFEWGSYDQALYNYSKNPQARAGYVRALEGAIARGKARNALAPGLQAELGYLKLEAGDTQAAVALFEAEAASFPEAATFMRRAIAATSAPIPPPATDSVPSAPVEPTQAPPAS